MVNFFIAKRDDEYDNAALLFKDYIAWLNIDLRFQHFEEGLKGLKAMYAVPHGGIILCKIENEFIA